MSALIRVVRIEDVQAIARVHVVTWRAAYAGVVPDDFLANLSEENRAHSWQQQITECRTTVLVAENDGDVVGFAAGGASRDADSEGDAEIYAIYVLPERWGCGVGRDLMVQLEETIASGRSVTLWVLRENDRANRFYERIGYRKDGAEKEIQIGGRSLIEVRMRKTGTKIGPG